MLKEITSALTHPQARIFLTVSSTLLCVIFMPLTLQQLQAAGWVLGLYVVVEGLYSIGEHGF